jgi:hypothetical protein
MLAWSQTRFFFTLAVAALLVMEPVSWMTAPIQGGCLVNPENYAAYYSGENHCPTFHVFLIAVATPAWDHFGDPNWVIADFTAVLAFSTICLWAITWRASIRQSRDMEASIGVGEAANRLNREIAIASRRAWVTIEDVKLIHPTKFAEDGIVFRVQLTTRNLGQTPATNVEVVLESYFDENKLENFVDVQQRFIARLRAQPVELGQLLFPNDTDTYRQLWADGVEKMGAAIRTLPTGRKTLGFTILIGVSYRIVGDNAAHITYHQHGMLNVPIETAIQEGRLVDLPRQPFIAGIAD